MENGIIKYMYNRFSININEMDVKFIIQNERVYMCSNGLAEIKFNKIERKGMRAFKINSIYGIKPSLDFVLIYGHLAKKNYVVFNEEEIIGMYEGKEIIKNNSCEDGLVIIKNNKNEGKGIVFKKGNVLKSLIPKNRFIYRR